jgi:hypothetical protein
MMQKGPFNLGLDRNIDVREYVVLWGPYEQPQKSWA